jgi:hypothetical protein
MNFACRFNVISGIIQLVKNNTSVFQKYMIVYAYPASAGGAYRDRHGRWKRDAMDGLARETSALGRTAKPRGPDSPTLESSFVRRFTERRWLSSPDTGESAG